MHDAFGRELKVGDRVMVPMVVKSIHLTEDFCNVEVETVATMPPQHQHKTTLSAMNTQMLLRGNNGDDLNYRVSVDGLGTRLVPLNEPGKDAK